ncbi:hypothetical protein DV515_00007744, partial [Chloebia gouldiae]
LLRENKRRFHSGRSSESGRRREVLTSRVRGAALPFYSSACSAIAADPHRALERAPGAGGEQKRSGGAGMPGPRVEVPTKQLLGTVRRMSATSATARNRGQELGKMNQHTSCKGLLCENSNLAEGGLKQIVALELQRCSWIPKPC